MVARRRSDYQVFVSARMRALAPHGLAESRRAMQVAAAEWRAMQHGRRGNPDPDLYEEDNPRRYRRRYRRRNPSSNQLLTWALVGGAVYYLFLRNRGPA